MCIEITHEAARLRESNGYDSVAVASNKKHERETRFCFFFRMSINGVSVLRGASVDAASTRRRYPFHRQHTRGNKREYFPLFSSVIINVPSPKKRADDGAHLQHKI